MLLLSCNESDEAISRDNPNFNVLGVPFDTLTKWKTWAMRTDDGLWENETGHTIQLNLVQIYGGENLIDPPFFRLNWLSISGDTIFISDQAQEAIVCMGIDGTVHWTYGEEGEGPGHFCRILATDCSENWIAVCNVYGERIELLSRAGELIRIFSISNPQDVITINDTTFAVLSKSEPGGDVHIFHIEHGLQFSFGEAPWSHHGKRANRDLNGLLIGEQLAVLSRFGNQLFFYDLEDKTVSDDFSRIYPTSFKGTEVFTDDNGAVTGGLAYLVMGNFFTGPEGKINVGLMPFAPDGSFRTSGNDPYGPVTIMDRYDNDGIYLDSYCIPVSGAFFFEYSCEHGLFVYKSATGTLYRFEIML